MAKDEEEGCAALYPVVGWDVASLREGNAMLALRYVPGIPPIGMANEEMQAAALVHRFGLTAEQCDQLAEVLMITAAESCKRRGASH
jgi:hypothetical protein